MALNDVLIYLNHAANVFAENKIYLAKDGSNFDDAVKELFRKVVPQNSEFFSWISRLDASHQWSALFFYLIKNNPRFKPIAEKEAHGTGEDGKYKNNNVLITTLNDALRGFTDCTQRQADVFLESLNVIEPGLYQWAEHSTESIPGNLDEFITNMLGREATAEYKKEELLELARSTEALRAKFVQFNQRIGTAKNLKKHRTNAENRAKKDSKAHRESIELEIGTLHQQVHKSFELILTNKKLKAALIKAVHTELGDPPEYVWSSNPEKNAYLKKLNEDQRKLEIENVATNTGAGGINIEIGSIPSTGMLVTRGFIGEITYGKGRKN